MHAHSMDMDMDMGACKMHNPAACHSRVSPPPLATPVCLARPREGGARVWVVGSFHMCSSRARVAFWYITGDERFFFTECELPGVGGLGHRSQP